MAITLNTPNGMRTIGHRAPPFIIAEAGVNHNGDINSAVALIHAAKEAGADAVKFQLFTTEELVTANASTAQYQQRTTNSPTQAELLRKLELTPAQVATIVRECQRVGIQFLATPFSESQLELALDMGVMAIKIGSGDLTNHPLLSRAAASNLPLLVSTGAALQDEVDDAVALIRGQGAFDRLLLLHCVSAYPTPLSLARLTRIAQLAARYRVPIGYSDHTTSVLTGGYAVAAGACLLEKHLTLNPADTGPDHASSLDPQQFARYVQHAHQAHAAMTHGATINYDPIEADVRTAARRSLVANTTIHAGQTVTRDQLILKRPGTGLPPSAIEQLIGCVASCTIPADTVISWNMVTQPQHFAQAVT